ncbi:MAG: hypothetical protein V3V09_06880 [Arenicellales bacterium]
MTKNMDKTPQETTKTISSGRRKALLGALTSATVATVWHKPIVNAVMLPSHAQTTQVEDKKPDAMAALKFFGAAVAAAPTVMLHSPLDYIISPAIAGESFPSEYKISVVQADTEGELFTISVFESRDEAGFNQAEVLYSGQVMVGASGALNVTEDPCSIKPVKLAVKLVSVSAASSKIDFTGRAQTVNVPAGSGVLPSPMCSAVLLPDSFFGQGLGGGQSMSSHSPLDFLVPVAHAGMEVSFGFGVSASKVDENSYDVEHLNKQGDVLRKGRLNVSGSSGTLSVSDNPCPRKARDIPAQIVSVDQFDMKLSIQPRKGSPIILTVPVGSGSLVAICNQKGSGDFAQ